MVNDNREIYQCIYARIYKLISPDDCISPTPRPPPKKKHETNSNEATTERLNITLFFFYSAQLFGIEPFLIFWTNFL